MRCTEEYRAYSEETSRVTGQANAGATPPLTLGVISEANVSLARKRLEDAGFWPVFSGEGNWSGYTKVSVFVYPHQLREAFAKGRRLIQGL